MNTAFFMGVIAGFPDGSFKAENPVTYAEAITMLVKAIPQHKTQVPTGIWPWNFMFYAVDEGFTGAVDVGAGTANCTRGDMAELFLETMEVDPVAADGHHDVGDAILEEHRLRVLLTGLRLPELPEPGRQDRLHPRQRQGNDQRRAGDGRRPG